MRRLAALILPVALVFGLAGCDRYPDDDAFGHCRQSGDWNYYGIRPLGYVTVTRWYRFRWEGDWWYHCEGYDPLGRSPSFGFCMRWNTHYASQESPPHEPLNISLCPDPT